MYIFNFGFRMRETLILSAGLLAGMSNAFAGGSLADIGVAPHSFVKGAQSVKGEYIVVLDTNAEDVAAQGLDNVVTQLTQKHHAKLRYTYRHSIQGFSIKATEAQARRLAAEPGVAYVVENGVVHTTATQRNPPWGLDRIDQRQLPLDAAYTTQQTGAGVNAYIIDTGIRATHTDFGGRASGDFTAVDDGNGTNDCNGHGTHVAGTIGSATYGVAKQVKLHAVRVLDCSGGGTFEQVIAGVDWVTAHAVLPAVANMSLGGSPNSALDQAVSASIKAGVVYVVSAGNDNAGRACDKSPARTFGALTVSATGKNDSRASFANIGKCVDIFAPGVGVLSTWNSDDTATAVLSGTSMAAPHVSGIVANYLQNNPIATVATAVSAVISQSTEDAVINAGARSPNHLASVLPAKVAALYRYANTNNNSHYYTVNWQELNAGNKSWKYEKINGYLAPTAGSGKMPFYYYVHNKSGDYVYTTDWSEIGNGNSDWDYKGIAGYCANAAGSDTQELYRFYNQDLGFHFYTTDWKEGGQNGWAYEGVGCQAYVNP